MNLTLVRGSGMELVDVTAKALLVVAVISLTGLLTGLPTTEPLDTVAMTSADLEKYCLGNEDL